MKLTIDMLEKMETYDENYNRNPLIDAMNSSAGVEDMNSSVQNTTAGLILNRFGFELDQLVAENNYPFASPEQAIESALYTAYDNLLNDKDFMEGVEAETHGIISRIWETIKSFFGRIFGFIFGKGTSDKTSIRYYARTLKEKIKALMSDKKQSGSESLEKPTNAVETMEVLNKITPHIHLVGQIIADALSTSYTDNSLSNKLEMKLRQMEKSYKIYENALKNIELSSIDISLLSQVELSKLYNQTVKFEMLWKQFESTRKLVDSINIDDLRRRMISNEHINILMFGLKKVQSGILTIRTVVRSLNGKISSGNESDDYYIDIFDNYEVGTEMSDIMKMVGATALVGVGAYATYHLASKLFNIFKKKSIENIDKSIDEIKKSREEIKQIKSQIRKISNEKDINQIKMSDFDKENIRILDYSVFNVENLRNFETTLRGIKNIMFSIQKGNFNSYLSVESNRSNITNLVNITNKLCSSFIEVKPTEIIFPGGKYTLDQVMESLSLVCIEFRESAEVVRSFDQFKNLIPPKDKVDQLPPDKQEAIKKYIENLPNELNAILGCYNRIKTAILTSNKEIQTSILSLFTANYRGGLNGNTVKHDSVANITEKNKNFENTSMFS